MAPVIVPVDKLHEFPDFRSFYDWLAVHHDRQDEVWIRIFPDKPVTMKAAETRMGSGKGSVDHYVAVVKPGRIIFEVSGVEESVARNALRLAAQKLPIETTFVRREVMGGGEVA